jgi:hypothetical protein
VFWSDDRSAEGGSLLHPWRPRPARRRAVVVREAVRLFGHLLPPLSQVSAVAARYQYFFLGQNGFPLYVGAGMMSSPCWCLLWAGGALSDTVIRT